MHAGSSAGGRCEGHADRICPCRRSRSGFVNAHSHAFQRALRGRDRGGDFWAWREEMLALAASLTVAESAASTPRSTGSFVPTATRRSASSTTSASTRRSRRPRPPPRPASSYAASSPATSAAASHASGRSRLPTTSPSSSGCGRDGISGRGRPPLRARLPGRGAARSSAATRTSTSCRCTSTPTSSRARSTSAWPSTASARSSCSPARGASARAPRSCTRRTPTARELDLLRDAGARICVCPTTEANLGDGFLPVARVCHREIGMCIGSDSNVRIDPLEELRELEGIARRQTGKRGVISLDALLCFGSDEGAAALGLETWPDAVVDLDHPQLRGVDEARRLRRLWSSAARRRAAEDVATSSAFASGTRTRRRRPCSPHAPS